MSDELTADEQTQLTTALNRIGIGVVQGGLNTLGTMTVELIAPPEAIRRLLLTLSGEEEVTWL